MQKRTFPLLRRPVSEIGLGCWQLGGDWGAVDEGLAMRILAAAEENGIDFFDTADAYGSGRSETLIGRYLRSTRTRPFIATKVGRFPAPGMPDNLRPEIMRRHVEASLRRVGLDAIDLVQLHCVPRAALEAGDVFDTLARLRDEGKLRAYGASVESIDEGLLCLERGVASLQIIFNLLRQDPAEHLIAEARRRRAAIIVRLPLASGVLAGRYTAETRFGPDDHRSYNRDGAAFHVGETFAGIPFHTALELTAELRDLAPHGYTLAEFAQRWILDHAEVTTVITGATDPDQVFENAGTSDMPPLDPELHDQLHAFYLERVRPHIRGRI